MNNCLVFITSSYPFLSQESFIEPEMPYLKDFFSKIITLAIDLDKGVTEKRKTPSNVDSYNIATKRKKIVRTLEKAEGAARCVIGSDISRLDKEAKSFKQKAFAEYFRLRGEREARKCIKILSQYDFSKYDSVTVYSYWFFVAAYIGARIKDDLSSQCKNIKLVSRAHGYDVYESVNKLNYLPFREFLLKSCDNVCPCSENGKNHIAGKYPDYSDKIITSYLGTADRGVNISNDDCFHIVSCSRVVSLKRLDKLVNALAKFKNFSTKKIKWTHIGDGPELENLKIISKQKLDFMDVEFIGEICNDAVLDYYCTNGVDLFINVSSTEGLPVSIMEANSFGIPVIATDVGGVKEIVVDKFNGKLIDVDFTSTELSEEILNYINMSADEKSEIRNNARQHWENNFNAEKNYSEFIKRLIL